MVESSSNFDPAHPRLSIHVSENEILRLVGVDSEPVNHGWLSDKDRFGFEYVRSDNRLTTPLVRRGDQFEAIEWADALDMVSNRLGLIGDESGGQAIGVLGGSQGTNEDAYALSKFARTVLKTNNVDSLIDERTPAHFLAATVDRGLISDLDTADTILVWGPDLKETHPTLYLRVRRAAQELGVQLVVVHPRATGLDDRADRILRYRPGGGFQLLKDLEAGLPADVSDLITGNVVAIVGQASLADDPQLPESVAAVIRDRAEKVKIIPLTSRANTYGALDMGMAPDLLPGRVAYRSEAMESSWGELPSGQGRGAKSIFEGLRTEELRALLMVGADPAGDLPEEGAVEALELAEYVVAIDAFMNDSNRHADVIFPAAVFSEKEGTTTNVEGRVQKVNAITPAPGSSRPDWAILDDLSVRMGAPMGLSSVEVVAKEVNAVALAYQDVTWDRLEWEDRDGLVVTDADGVLVHIPVRLNGPTAPGAELTLHISKVMYDDGVRLRNCPSLRLLAPGAVVHIHPDDARRLGAQEGYEVDVTTSKGEGRFRARIDADTPPGVVFVPQNQPGAPRLGIDPVVRVKVVT
jgi:NADH-quinone oxidoreductase subunit G